MKKTYHKTDNLTCAVNKVGSPEEFTANYQGLAKHYGFTSCKTQPAHPNENGDIEQRHHRFKKALEQALILRGSRDFNSQTEYEDFLEKLLDQLNAGRTKLLDLELDKLLKKLSRFDVMMIDDFGYVKQDRDEMEVLFTLLAHRYERGSMLITSNLPFSRWETIFKDPMTTAAAIDRLVHHSVVLELNVPSYRVEQAKKRKNKDK